MSDRDGGNPVTGVDQVRRAVADGMPRVVDELSTLVRIPSIAFEGFPVEPVREAAEATAELLRASGVDDARLEELDPGHPPAVIGEVRGPIDAPTVLLYAHYDVQPVGDPDAWTSPPFEPSVREGRLWGRGSADDKSGIVAHVAALRALRGLGDARITLRFLIEGEEETGTSALEAVVPTRPELFAADAILVADMGNLEAGVPALTTSLRGVTSVVVEVRTLEGEVHSGLFGGPVPDALMALIRMLATLHDAAGDVAVEGLAGTDWAGADVGEDDLRRMAGIVEAAGLVGSGTVGSRLWSKPSINVIGIDAPQIHGSRNVLIDVARARVSLRVPPAQSPADAQVALIRHLRASAPWGAEVTVTPWETGPGVRVPSDGPAYAAMRAAMTSAFGTAPVEQGSGGSIPLIDTLVRTFPTAEVLMFGAEEPSTNIHAPNESVDLSEWERVILAEALFLQRFARS